jgi:beta-glucosidase/6-phospho-beta-glucosidase/beta-galactosidase
MTTCLKSHSNLPGHVGKSCTTIAANTGQGGQTSMMWSSIFKTTFNKKIYYSRYVNFYLRLVFDSLRSLNIPICKNMEHYEPY